ncbi:MAG: ParA family protein [Clostridia bacterium]|nr:ParA family protein [Clostridia bacterium]
MGKIIAITNQKGGVGKTTTAVNLSALLASAGKRVLVIDLDPQGNTTSGLGMEAGAVSIYETLTGAADMAEAAEETDWPGLYLAAGDIRLVGAELELAGLPQREHRLKNVLQPARALYDFIMIDCPPSLGLLTLNALTAADTVLIPIQCEYFALEGVSSLMNTLNRVRKSLNPGLEIEGVLLTMLDGRTNLGLQVVDEVKKHFRQKVYAVTIPRSVRLGEAPSHGEPIHIYDPNSTGALAYRNLTAEFLRRNGMEAPEGFTAAAAGKAKKPKDKKKHKKK